MAGKGFNIFSESATRCVNVLPQEERFTTSIHFFLRDSKMYISGSIVNSQSMLNLCVQGIQVNVFEK